ncbi:ApeI family dehydratase [Vibrio mediterranei]|uniref:3-hydroxyacyl-ACP dehydratase n=1 Tax=Vibrio mediterranei TaxID=689 RepID=A0ABX5D8W5_9VIBR|nr:3-hydroxyacyl-ACP dehydratase [Vibrio mediterranei]PCD86301.1 3-hydroxyacyl-ACP dehydratase [Vibrio mediterranei]PRQ66102.1 3-hydroxyacyl-ACP dehydratase [Vibrio mediterranei]
MTKRKPTVLNSDVQSASATLCIQADADILDFCGHFNHFPLLPGVTQIDWALHYAVEYLNVPSAFKGMEVIKFQEPILPDAIITLTLNWNEETQKLAFKYASISGEDIVVHSSGKMKLGSSSE